MENSGIFYPPPVIATVAEPPLIVAEVEQGREIETLLPDLLMIYQLAKL